MCPGVQVSTHQTTGCITMPLGMEVGLSPGDFVFDGDPAPPQKGGGAPSPIFGPCLWWPNGWLDQDGTWHGGGPWSRPHCAKWETSSPPQKGGRAPQFSAHFYCRQTAGCIKMPLGVEVGLSPRNFVLDEHPAPVPKRGRSPPIFGPCLLPPNGWMDEAGTWHGGRPQFRRLCVRW